MAYLSESDTLCGIERYPASDDFGEVVCPVIILWKTPGAKSESKNVAGALKHVDPVAVTQKKRRMGRDWYFVRNEEQDQEGWVLAAFLEKLGEQDARRVLA
jgi:hypothetical protein